MHIIEKIRLDGVRRLSIGKLFVELPEMVVVSFETKSKRLFFQEAANDKERKIARKVDEKGRVCLPRWMQEEMGEYFYVCAESLTEHYVLPAKFVFAE